MTVRNEFNSITFVSHSIIIIIMKIVVTVVVVVTDFFINNEFIKWSINQSIKI